jgi:hypothetical protein
MLLLDGKMLRSAHQMFRSQEIPLVDGAMPCNDDDASVTTKRQLDSLEWEIMVKQTVASAMLSCWGDNNLLLPGITVRAVLPSTLLYVISADICSHSLRHALQQS